MTSFRFAPRRFVGTVTAALLTVGILGAQPAPAQEDWLSQSEIDSQALEGAKAACTRRDFSEFLPAFIASSKVRARYSTIPTEPFRIAQVDYSYADAASVARWEADPKRPFTELAVDVTEFAGNGRRVTYQPAIFRDEGEGDGRLLVRRQGKPASYVFTWQQGCWMLSKQER